MSAWVQILYEIPIGFQGELKERAGLARAVLRPKILLADEPSSGLDRMQH